MLQKRSRILSVNPFKRRLRNILPDIKTYIPGVLPAFLLLLFVFLVYNLFAIRRVSCTLNNSPCPVEIIDKLHKYEGVNVLLVNQKSLSQSLKSSFPIEKVSIGFKIFNTLSVRLDGRLSPVNIQAALLKKLPELSLDKTLVSSEAAIFSKPSSEIDDFDNLQNFANFEIWDNGQMTPVASAESKFKYLLINKPSSESIKSLYRLIGIVEKYLSVSEFLILDQRVFLSQPDQPDIIVNIPFDEDTLVQALQSYPYLTSIKKDAKVIDLRFKNPILR